MDRLNLPAFNYKVIRKEDKLFIFDNCRRKYVSLTPEEWVRQHFVHFLIHYKSFPAGRIGNEISLELNGMKKRSDTVVYDSEGLPFVIVEYKAPTVKISQQTFDQIVRYNMVMKVNYLIVSNGVNHYCCKIDYIRKSYEFLKEIPNFNEL